MGLSFYRFILRMKRLERAIINSMLPDTIIFKKIFMV
jgi:hypothetical protein